MQKSYKYLIIWQRAQELFEMVCEDTKKWPKTIIANTIAAQLARSMRSISTNVAEGYGRGGPKEFEQFFRYARGSLAESDNWLYKAMREELISELRYSEYCSKMEEVSKMTASFINKLRLQFKIKTI